MVDNRSAGFFGIGGSFNFKGGDISGTAAKTQDDKMGQGGEYFSTRNQEDEQDEKKDQKYMDRSAVLRATLNSLAMMNVANVINAKKRSLLEEKNQQNKNKQNNKNSDNNDSDKKREELEKQFNDKSEEITD